MPSHAKGPRTGWSGPLWNGAYRPVTKAAMYVTPSAALNSADIILIFMMTPFLFPPFNRELRKGKKNVASQRNIVLKSGQRGDRPGKV